MNAERTLRVESPSASECISGGGNVRLAYLTNISSPYRIEMVEAWARLNPALEITVYYTDSDDQGRGWRTRPMLGVKEHKLGRLIDIKGYGKLNRGLWDLVIHNDLIMIGGFEQLSYLVAAVMSKFRNKPVILLFDGFSPARFKTERCWVKGVKCLTAWLSDVYFANGSVGRQYLLERLLVSKSKPIHNQYLSHANSSIEAARRRMAGKSKDEIRADLHINSERMVLLSCGYLVRRKRNDLVVEAISRMPEERRPLFLIVGTGPLQDALAEQAKASGVPVHFAGFQHEEELAAYYFAADALVLASEDDPWGLVVNEAMSAGLPVLVSDACGASLDMVREGVNGFTFRSGSVAELLHAIERLQAADCRLLGAYSNAIIQAWSADQSARSLANCVEYALAEKRDGVPFGGRMTVLGSSETLCPICGAAAKQCFETRYAQVDQCSDVNCGHLFAENPKLDAGVHEHDTIDVSIYKRRNEVLIKKLLRDGYIKNGDRVLDIGAGLGHIASELRRQAPSVEITCVEAAPMSVAHLRTCGFKVIKDISSNTSEINGSFDFVFMIELIEHVSDPVRLLADCRAAMKPNGRILLTTPCGELRNKDHRAATYRVPEHIQFFTVNSLRLAVKKAGFDSLQLTEMHAYHAGSSSAPLKWMKDCARSLRNLIQGKHHLIAVIQ